MSFCKLMVRIWNVLMGVLLWNDSQNLRLYWWECCYEMLSETKTVLISVLLWNNSHSLKLHYWVLCFKIWSYNDACAVLILFNDLIFCIDMRHTILHLQKNFLKKKFIFYIFSVSYLIPAFMFKNLRSGPSERLTFFFLIGPSANFCNQHTILLFLYPLWSIPREKKMFHLSEGKFSTPRIK
jgi:hypothetical protein